MDSEASGDIGAASLNNFIHSTMPTEDVEDTSSSDSDSGSDSDDGRPCREYVDLGLEDSWAPEAECLFCSFSHPDAEHVILTHAEQDHKFSFREFLNSSKMDEIACLKMVNYYRKEFKKTEGQSVIDLCARTAPRDWEDDKYCIPTKNDDPLLLFFWGSLLLENANDDAVEGVKEEDNAFSNPEELEQVRLSLKNAFDLPLPAASASVKRSTPSEKPAQKPEMSKLDDSCYFENYSDVVIHRTMINDRVRTETYRNAILNNASDFKDKYVLDVGCGTGILSMFAAQAGAKKVFAVDKSEILLDAFDIICENNLSDKIVLKSGCMEEVELPVEKVDIIISEWMGYFLLFEGMLSSVIHARDKYLAKGGLLLPNAARIFICGVEDKETYKSNIGLWDDVYGFKMSSMKKRSLNITNVGPVSPATIRTSSAELLSLDLLTCTESEAAGFDTEFTLTVQTDSLITALVGYFDCDFTMGSTHKDVLHTGPNHESTHWEQTTFFLRHPIQTVAGQELKGTFNVSPSKVNPRHLTAKVVIGDQKLYYEIS